MDTLLLAKLLGRLRWKAPHIFFNHQTAQAKSVEDDIEVMEHIYHAKRHVSSFSSRLAQFNLFVRRLGGYEAAAFALWWLEEGSNAGLHVDKAFVAFAVL